MDDLHALAVQDAIRGLSHAVPCYVIEGDQLSGTPSLSWSAGAGSGACTLRARCGTLVNVGEVRTIWWRRVAEAQRRSAEFTDLAHADLINNDCGTALLGALLTDFHGTWISDPIATRRAENKLVQLRMAEAVGLRVPRTLVSQDPERVAVFRRSCDVPVIVKPVRGTLRAGLLTGLLQPGDDIPDGAIMAAPAIYQEYIGGDKHLRVNCFAREVYAALIYSSRVDWRTDLHVPFKPTTISSELTGLLHQLLDVLGLRMGVFDLKVPPDDFPVWLELNAQGQWLFVEALTAMPLARAFAEFLLSEHAKVVHQTIA
jgi:glutathione synthase/RimK-type ligase-like ATP-grasp enzyme